MKYMFFTILHNLKIESKLNKGIKIYSGTRISNGNEVLHKTIFSNLLRSTAGVHSTDEFNNKVYYYKIGEFSDVMMKEEMDEKGSMTTFYFLREAEQFVHSLWMIKDNNVYIRDGFLIVYEDDLEQGFTYKAALTTIYSASSGSELESSFSKEEVIDAISYFTPFTLEEMETENFGGKYLTNNHFYKSSKQNRINRAWYFVVAARAAGAPPMKIVSYCTALECLFTTDKSEVVHKIAERTAALLGTSGENKREIFNFVKKAYGLRSTVIHGALIKGNDHDLISVTTGLDDILRRIIKLEDHEVFLIEEKELDNYFLNMLFNYGGSSI